MVVHKKHCLLETASTNSNVISAFDLAVFYFDSCYSKFSKQKNVQDVLNPTYC